MMRKVFVRSPYNYDRDAASLRAAFFSEEEDMTQQSFKEECDINTIVRRFGITGQMPDNVRTATYADFEDIFDFKTAMDAVARAREAFDELPADLRKRFLNDPQKYVEFCSDPKNVDEMVDLGLATRVKKEDSASSVVAKENGDGKVGDSSRGAAGSSQAPVESAKADGGK